MEFSRWACSGDAPARPLWRTETQRCSARAETSNLVISHDLRSSSSSIVQLAWSAHVRASFHGCSGHCGRFSRRLAGRWRIGDGSRAILGEGVTTPAYHGGHMLCPRHMAVRAPSARSRPGGRRRTTFSNSRCNLACEANADTQIGCAPTRSHQRSASVCRCRESCREVVGVSQLSARCCEGLRSALCTGSDVPCSLMGKACAFWSGGLGFWHRRRWHVMIWPARVPNAGSFQEPGSVDAGAPHAIEVHKHPGCIRSRRVARSAQDATGVWASTIFRPLYRSCSASAFGQIPSIFAQRGIGLRPRRRRIRRRPCIGVRHVRAHKHELGARGVRWLDIEHARPVHGTCQGAASRAAVLVAGRSEEGVKAKGGQRIGSATRGLSLLGSSH